jgi:hypothetical protein
VEEERERKRERERDRGGGRGEQGAVFIYKSCNYSCHLSRPDGAQRQKCSAKCISMTLPISYAQIELVTRCDLVASGEGKQKVLQCVYNVLIFGYFGCFDNFRLF